MGPNASAFFKSVASTKGYDIFWLKKALAEGAAFVYDLELLL